VSEDASLVYQRSISAGKPRVISWSRNHSWPSQEWFLLWVWKFMCLVKIKEEQCEKLRGMVIRSIIEVNIEIDSC